MRRLRIHLPVATLAVVLGVLLAGCDPDSQAPGDCQCTTEFVTVSFRVIDDSGTPLPGVAVQSRIQRTNQVLDIEQFSADQGVYFVATDRHTDQVRPGGDTIVVEGSLGERRFSETFVVNVPGDCACHVAKVSGPETVMIGR